MSAIGQQAKALGREVAFIIKWNPRTTPVETVAKAKVAPQCQTTCRSPLKLWTTHKGAPSMTKNRYSREFESKRPAKSY